MRLGFKVLVRKVDLAVLHFRFVFLLSKELWKLSERSEKNTSNGHPPIDAIAR